MAKWVGNLLFIVKNLKLDMLSITHHYITKKQFQQKSVLREKSCFFLFHPELQTTLIIFKKVFKQDTHFNLPTIRIIGVILCYTLASACQNSFYHVRKLPKTIFFKSFVPKKTFQCCMKNVILCQNNLEAPSLTNTIMNKLEMLCFVVR